jgi:hypothetical protein
MPRAFAFVVGVVASLAACGNSDGSGDDEDEESHPIRTCDYRGGQRDEPRCSEWGPGRSTDGLVSACGDNDGKWSYEACPPEDRLGCCSYVANGTVRECFYDGETRDQATLCVEVHGGSWTPD